MTKEQILAIIEEEVQKLGWTMELALPYMATLGFTPEIVEGNSLFGEHKLRMTVEMAYYAFEDEAKKAVSEPIVEVTEEKYDVMYGLFGIGTDEFLKTHGVFFTEDEADTYLREELGEDYLGDVYIDSIKVHKRRE